jgi:SAM-dependent methyltransferase
MAIDTVFCANVLEHVPDHQTAVRNMVEIVQPGGHVLLFVPAFRWLYNDLDRLAGHQRRYMMQDLVRLAPPNAKIRRLEYFNPAAVLPWWLNGRVTHRSLETPLVNSQVAFFDRYVLPISRAVTPLTRKWFGQSIVCVLRRT